MDSKFKFYSKLFQENNYLNEDEGGKENFDLKVEIIGQLLKVVTNSHCLVNTKKTKYGYKRLQQQIY